VSLNHKNKKIDLLLSDTFQAPAVTEKSPVLTKTKSGRVSKGSATTTKAPPKKKAAAPKKKATPKKKEAPAAEA